MAFTLYSLLEAGLLIINAIAILNKDRFLSRSKKICFLQSSNYSIFTFCLVGWTHEQYRGFGEAVDSNSTKSKLINLIASVQTVMRGINR